MDEEIARFSLEKPRWNWRSSGWWFNIWGVIIALIVLFFPDIVDASLLVRIVLSFAALLLIPVGLNFVSYLLKLLGFAYKKVSLYDELLSGFASGIERLSQAQDTILSLSRILEDKYFLEINRVQLYKNTLYIVIRKRRRLKLTEGQSILIIDSNDGFPMGYFKIMKVGKSEYFASENGYIDPLWMGYVMNEGEGEMSPLPGMIGVVITGD